MCWIMPKITALSCVLPLKMQPVRISGYLKSIFKSAEDHGADYVSIADTVGILNPSTAFYLVSEIKKTIKTKLCIHCHNDLGMAVANTLSGAEAGAFQLHTTVNGIGERCGNAALEELLVSLRVQYGIEKI